MAAELKHLLKQREHLKLQFTRLSMFIENYNDEKILELQARLDKIEFFFNEFHAVQTKIEILDENERDSDERDKTENTYYSLVASGRHLCLAYTAKMQATQAQQVVVASGEGVVSEVKLPILHLPKFYGDYDKWTQFHETFKTLVDNNKNIDDVQKFYYLLDCLKGEAEKVLMSLEVTSANYKVAWDLLRERFENKPVIIQAHLKALLDMPVLGRESFISLRNLADTLERNVRALKSLGEPVESWDRIILFLISRKLDTSTKKEWEEKTISDFAGSPKFTDFTKFLANRCRVLETIGPVNHKSSKPFLRKFSEERTTSHLLTNHIKCEFCKGSHFIYRCEDFLALSVSDRANELKKAKLCLNCLRSNHFITNCRAEGCKRCQGKHNTLLHVDRIVRERQNSLDENRLENVAISSNINSSNENRSTSSVVTHCIQSKRQTQVILSTAIIFIKDASNNYHKCRALLDNGSQSNFLTRNLVERLLLKTNRVNISVLGVSESLTTVKGSTWTTIRSAHNNFTADLSFLVIEKITTNIPVCSIDMQIMKIPPNITLADPTFNISSPIDILLGAGLFYELLSAGQIKLGIGQPILQKSILGWIVSGPVTLSDNSVGGNKGSTSCNLSVGQDVQAQLEKFWSIEECTINKTQSKEDIECENEFVNTFYRDETGRFVVTLPLREYAGELGDSLTLARKRLYSLERKLEKNWNLKEQYHNFMAEYSNLGHMTKIDTINENIDTKTHYYLPHHAVINESSLTTKLRVVFDASAKTSSGLSLNDILKVGPCIQDDLLSIMLRFRKHVVVITSDIEKMYRQVNVVEHQRDLQRILWRNNRNEEVQHYRLNTATYGTGPASFLTTRCLYQIALDIEKSEPALSKIITKDFYMDDLITGTDDIDMAIQLGEKLSSILNSYGFVLRKWASNEDRVLQKLGNDKSKDIGYFVSEDDTKETLGVFWKAKGDSLEYIVNLSPLSARTTKRMILSIVSKIFDPLGLVGPATIRAKLILRRLWELKLDWDESVPLDLFSTWNEFHKDLAKLNELEIPRRVLLKNPVRIELHGFCDASQFAYGACIYLRSINNRGEMLVRLLCAKSRVAPIKSISIPKLELCGALLLARLVHKTVTALNLELDEVCLWTDSTIVLAWISDQPNSWKVFVSNRVSEIQSLTKTGQWAHVRSEENSADIISRGINPGQLSESTLWWNGPKWLSAHSNIWPNHSSKLILDAATIPERRNLNITFVNITPEFNIFIRFSSLYKLQCVVGWCLRFYENSKLKNGARISGRLSIEELDNALIVLIRLMQYQEFESELKELSKSKAVSNQSKIKSLDPFLDENGLIRVGGRLRKSNISNEAKFPIILAQKHPLTKLVILNQHFRHLHAGAQTVLYGLRQRYWPINGRTVVRGVLSKCIVCFRVKPSVLNQKMGDLPKNRLTPCRTFWNCGVDYAGPFNLKDGKLRNRAIIKAYLCLFVCFSTKAVHIELVGDLSTEAFLNCLKRFVSRRGLCANIYSDNGSNFVGANNDLKEFKNDLSKVVNENRVTTFLNQNKIKWHFIPARSPHQGGLWEAAIKSAKYHVKRIIGNRNLTFEELSTIFTQVEAVLNSRPLTPLSNDPNDLLALTPGHFLIGDSLDAVPQSDVKGIPENRLGRYLLLQQIVQHFWHVGPRNTYRHCRRDPNGNESKPTILVLGLWYFSKRKILRRYSGD